MVRGHSPIAKEFIRPARPDHLPALTGLRFFLALWVIVNHLVGQGHVYEPAAQALPGPLQAIMRGGYMAVPTFFMLSGLVLARNYAAISWTPRNLRKYALGRLARIYPVYLLSLAIVAPFIIKAPISPTDAEPKAWLVAMHLTLMQGWWVGHYTAGWNTPAWSLSCEMFFYLVFPLLVTRWQRWTWPVIAPLALLACAATQLLWAAGVSDQLKPIIHLPDFLMGIALARACELLTARPNPPTGAWLYSTGLLGTGLLIGYAQYLPSSLPLTVLLRPMNALILLGLALGQGPLARLLARRPLVYLGKASYAMYILHIPILWWAVSWPGNTTRNFYVAFVIATACLIYTLLEEPANRYLRSFATRGQQRLR